MSVPRPVHRWLLYGANGYTGRLIAEEALRAGQRPVLAGRRADAVEPIARELGLEWRAFALTSAQAVEAALDGIDLVLHAAGPFSETSAPMVAACLARRVHYLDITGEIAVFEACRARDAEARAAGVALVPGVGFDVVPTDCLAAALAERLPDATRLTLAFGGGAGLSRGTAKTMLSGLALGGAVREGGRIRRVPLAWRTMMVPFRDRPRFAMTIPWGDISTAYTSTRIPNIETYTATTRGTVRALRLARLAKPLLGSPWMQRRLRTRVERTVAGPGAQARARGRMHVWGRVANDAGDSRVGTAELPEGYRFTAMASVEAAVRVLASPPAPGYHTPSTAFGWRFFTSLPECDLEISDGAPLSGGGL